MSFFYYTPYKISQSPRRNHRGAHWAEKQPLQGMETASGKRTREHHDTDRPYNGNGRCSGPEDEHEHRQYRTITGGVLGEDDFNAEDSDEPSHTPSAVDRAGLAHHVDIPKVGARMQGPVGATAAEVNNAAAPAQLMVEDPWTPWGPAPPSVNDEVRLGAPVYYGRRVSASLRIEGAAVEEAPAAQDALAAQDAPAHSFRTHHSLVLDAVRDVPVWGNPPPSMTGWRILPEYAYQGLTERLASAEQRSTELQEQVNTLERVSDDHTTAINDMREQMTAERILQRRAMDDFKQEVYACGWPAPGSP